MKRALVIAVILLLWAAPAWAQEQSQNQGCLDCHEGMRSPMPPPPAKALACTACHHGNAEAPDLEAAHQGLAANPSSLDHAATACGPCHPGWSEKVRRSPMATAMGLINQTRFLWGAQPDSRPRWAARAEPPLEALPTKAQSGRDVDDFLRRRCLQCHLGRADAAQGRSGGCAACHRPMARGNAPRPHALTKAVPTAQCLACHSWCGAGAQFSGLVPRDADRAARFDDADPDRPALWQAMSWRKMRPDAHHLAGMACVDCHARAEIMGDGRIRQAGLLHVGVRCTTCHGRPGQPPRDARTTHGAAMTNLRIGGGKAWLRPKLGGSERAVPLLSAGAEAPVAHLAPGHEKIACHACHNAANPAAWGLQVLLETRPALDQWLPQAAQGDPWLWQLLSGPAAAPTAPDYLSGGTYPGVWIVSPFFRRLAWRVYGLSPDGRTFLLSPRYQYVVSTLGPGGRPLRRSEIPSPGLGLTPWHAHTVARPTGACADCHGNAMALGLGQTFALPPGPEGQIRLAPELWQPRAEGLALDHGWTKAVGLDGRPLQAMLVHGARFYDAGELRGLLEPGKGYTRWLLRALERQLPEPAQKK